MQGRSADAAGSKVEERKCPRQSAAGSRGGACTEAARDSQNGATEDAAGSEVEKHECTRSGENSRSLDWSPKFANGHGSSRSGDDPCSEYFICRRKSVPGHRFRGVSVHHLGEEFLADVEAAGLSRKATIYDVEPRVILGKGAREVCPRDQRMGTAYVDAIHGPDNVGPATHMLSYAWFYTVGDIISALEKFCQDHGSDSRRVYVWMCSLCLNQHRVRERRATGNLVPFEQFQAEFSERVRGIGHILALMSPWESPKYLGRVWCIFELFTAVGMQEDQCSVTIVMPPREHSRFCKQLVSSEEDMKALWAALTSVQVEKAQSSVARDREAIMQLIEQGPGYEAVNASVAKYLTCWFASASEGHLERNLASPGCDVEAAAQMCAQAGRFLRNIGQYDRAMRVLQRGSRLMVEAGTQDAPTHARLLMDMGVVQKKRGDLDAALEALERARKVRKNNGTLRTALGVRLLNNIGSVKEASDDLDGAVEAYREARSVLESTAGMQTRDGAQMLRNEGLIEQRLGRLGEALAAYQAARKTLQAADLLHTPDEARVLNNIGVALCELGDLAGSEQALGDARRIREKTGTMDTAAGAELLASIGTLQQRLGNEAEADKAFLKAKCIAGKSGTMIRRRSTSSNVWLP